MIMQHIIMVLHQYLISDANWSTQVDIALYSDACGVGWGGILNNQHYCYGLWSERDLSTYTGPKSLKMSALELLALGNVLTTFGKAQLLKRMKINIWCDNTAAVQALRSGTCRDQTLMSIARSMHHIASLYDFEFRIEHVAGVQNVYADMLSRQLIAQFKQDCKTANQHATPTHLLLLHDW